MSHIYIAPGDFHMELRKTGSLFIIRLDQETPKYSVCPATAVALNAVHQILDLDEIGLALAKHCIKPKAA